MTETVTTTSAPPALVSDVFGASRGLALSYVSRATLDEQFSHFISQRRHLVVYGGTSQGKSCLVRKHVQPGACIEVQCSQAMRRYDLYRLLLREAGVYVSLGRKKKRMKGVSAEVTLVKEETGTESEVAEQTVQIDLSNINDILNLLDQNEFSKTIVLDDFHLLPGRIQRQIAADLKIVYERSSLQVIVIGAWRYEDRLASLSGYLPGRSNSISVDAWSPAELATVIGRGAEILNVSFGADVIRRLVELSSGNVGILQQLCQRVCQLAGVARAAIDRQQQITDPAIVDTALKVLVESIEGRYRLFIERYALTGARYGHRGPLRKWIMHAVISRGRDAIEQGLSATEIADHVNAHHLGLLHDVDDVDDVVDVDDETRARTVRPTRGTITVGDIVRQLRKIEKYQRRKDINPIILSYDKRRETLRAVDVGLLLFLGAFDRDTLLLRLPRFPDEFDEDTLARAARGEFDRGAKPASKTRIGVNPFTGEKMTFETPPASMSSAMLKDLLDEDEDTKPARVRAASAPRRRPARKATRAKR